MSRAGTFLEHPVRGLLLLLAMTSDPACAARAQEPLPTPPVRRSIDFPLDERGRLTVRVIVERLGEAVGLPLMADEEIADVAIPVVGWKGFLAYKALESALGEGWSLTLRADRLSVAWDPAVLAARREATRARLHAFLLARTGGARRAADAYGIVLPEEPLPAGQSPVLLVHGLDSSDAALADVAAALESEGFAVWRFRYPNDQAIGSARSGSRWSLSAWEASSHAPTWRTTGGTGAMSNASCRSPRRTTAPTSRGCGSSWNYGSTATRGRTQAALRPPSATAWDRPGMI